MTRDRSIVLALALAAVAPFAAITPALASAGQDGPAGRGQPSTLEAMQARQDRMFDRLDADHDGVITAAELVVLTQGPMAAQGGGRMRAMLARADADHDARISREEARAAGAARFHRMDANGDGVLSGDELPRPPSTRQTMPMPVQGDTPDGGMPPMGYPTPGGR